MNLAKIYSEARALPKEVVPVSEESREANRLLLSQHSDWLRHVTTQDLFEHLNKRKTELNKRAIEEASSGGDANKVGRLAAQIKIIEEILEYASTIPSQRSKN